MDTDCNNYNQYYTDVMGDPSKCFKGSTVYPKMKNFHINNFKEYKSKDYYSFINENLKEYSFNENYPSLTFKDICESSISGKNLTKVFSPIKLIPSILSEVSPARILNTITL